VLVQAGKHGGVQNVGRSHISFEENAQQLEDEDKNFGLLLEHELLDEHAEDVCVNHGLDAEGELRQINEAGVGVVSDLLDGVVEEGSGYFNKLVLNKNDTAHLRVRDLKDGAGGELSDVGVFVAETEEQLFEDVRLQGDVEFVSLVEIFVNFDEDLGAEDIVVVL
jgi:hypothetical protein